MRKHRLYGVVIAVLLGMGAITHHPGASHHAAGTDLARTGITLSSPVVRADPTQAPTAPAIRFEGFILHRDSTMSSDAMVRLRQYVPEPPPPPPTPPILGTATARPRPGPAPTVPFAAPAPPSGGVWASLRRCESGGDYGDDTVNGYFGAYQFTLGTWHSLGFSGLPSDAAPSVQDRAARELQARSGWGQWPSCSRALGLI